MGTTFSSTNHQHPPCSSSSSRRRNDRPRRCSSERFDLYSREDRPSRSLRLETESVHPRWTQCPSRGLDLLGQFSFSVALFSRHVRFFQDEKYYDFPHRRTIGFDRFDRGEDEGDLDKSQFDRGGLSQFRSALRSLSSGVSLRSRREQDEHPGDSRSVRRVHTDRHRMDLRSDVQCLLARVVVSPPRSRQQVRRSSGNQTKASVTDRQRLAARSLA